jgi:ubiquinone/menaquinone biosynthesis C-methylase UbiE
VSSDSDDERERQRIRKVYSAYERDAPRVLNWQYAAALRFMRVTKWDAVRRMLAREGIRPGSGPVVDLGAGDGDDGLHLLEVGWSEEEYLAFDLRPEGMLPIRSAAPRALCVATQASRMPLLDESVELVHQSTMLSSILDAERRAAVYAEIRRVVARGGLFLSYDMRRRNPWNRNTEPVTLPELHGAFTGWRTRSASLTAVPPLLRRLARIGPPAWSLAEAIPFLRTHLLFLARKP